MANVSWSSLEGKYFRMDVGTTKANALSATDNTILHLCTDGAIVMNGEVLAERNDTASGGDMSAYLPLAGGTMKLNSQIAFDCGTGTLGMGKGIAFSYGGKNYNAFGFVANSSTKFLQIGNSSVTAQFSGAVNFNGTVNFKGIVNFDNSVLFQSGAKLAAHDAIFYGSVYIGDSANGNKGSLSVYGATTIRDALTVNDGSVGQIQIGNGTTKATYLRNDGNYFYIMDGKTTSGWNDRRPIVVQVGTGTVMLGNSALTVVDSGNVTVARTLTAASVVQTSTSDLRAKENLNADFDALGILRGLGDVYEFDYKADGRHSYGLIAQNVEQTELKDMVGHVDEEDPESLRYVNYLDPRLTALLIKSVRQLQDEVAALREQLKNVTK